MDLDFTQKELRKQHRLAGDGRKGPEEQAGWLPAHLPSPCGLPLGGYLGNAAGAAAGQ